MAQSKTKRGFPWKKVTRVKLQVYRRPFKYYISKEVGDWDQKMTIFDYLQYYLLVTARSSGILKAKQKLGRTFNSDELGGIAFTKISKLTICSA